MKRMLRRSVNFRQAPELTSLAAAGDAREPVTRWPRASLGAGPQPTGSLIGQPVRLRSLPAAQAERMLARFEEAKERDVNERVKPDDAVVVPVRFISAGVVPGHWMDHRDHAHLKAAIPLFEQAPVYTMHWAEPSLWLGSVVDAEWDETPLGLEKAPGISGHVCIEGDVSERAKVVARGVLRRSIKRWSLGFCADYHPSHDEMARWTWEDYWLRLGDFDEDGNQYLLVCDRIVDVLEFSAVDQGAIESALTTDAPDNRVARARAKQQARMAAPKRPRHGFVARPVRRQQETTR